MGKGLDSFVLNDECIARLSRFQSRTAYTFATAQSSELYKYDVVKMAIEVSHPVFTGSNDLSNNFKHPFLMHIIQVITATHDRFLSDTKLDPKRSLTEAFHWSRGAALLNQKLSYPIRPQDRDAIWASAAMLGVANITSLEASTPAEAWPLKLADSSDLTWLYISQGKMALWDATNPLRPDSIFHFMADEYNVVMTEPSVLATEQMPTAFVSLCQLDEPLASENNPYYSAVSILAQLLPIECSQATMKSYLQFLNNMKAPFKKLLRQKDSRALLIMAYWYGGMQQSLWWVERRARLECQAICLYLERYHGDERDIQKMLVLPRKQCGLESSNTFTDIQLINVY